MKLLTIVIAFACATLTVSAVDEEEWVLEDVHDLSMEQIEIANEPAVKEPTTTTAATTTMRKSLVKTGKPVMTTSRPLPVVITAEDEAPVKPKNRKQPVAARPRNTPSARRVAAKESDDTSAEHDTKSTSPASLDTAAISILAPKNFKPTPRPINSEEDMAPKGLMEFLRKRKMERIAATTTEDPFIAILATATPPASEEPVAVKTDGRFSGSSKRFRGRNSSPASGGRTTTTTTTEPATEAPEIVTSRSKFTPNRFGNSRRNGSPSTAAATTTTTTSAPVVEETKQKFKPTPRKPAPFRPVGNSISRRREQSTTTASPIEDLPVEEEIEVIAPVTPRTFRRANARVSLRTSGI